MSTLADRGAREVNIILIIFKNWGWHQNYSKMCRSEILVGTEPISDQETALTRLTVSTIKPFDRIGKYN